MVHLRSSIFHASGYSNSTPSFSFSCVIFYQTEQTVLSSSLFIYFFVLSLYLAYTKAKHNVMPSFLSLYLLLSTNFFLDTFFLGGLHRIYGTLQKPQMYTDLKISLYPSPTPLWVFRSSVENYCPIALLAARNKKKNGGLGLDEEVRGKGKWVVSINGILLTVGNA